MGITLMESNFIAILPMNKNYIISNQLFNLIMLDCSEILDFWIYLLHKKLDWSLSLRGRRPPPWIDPLLLHTPQGLAI